MSTPLVAFEMPLSVWTEAKEPGTGLPVPGQAAQRFYRFEQPVRLDKVVIAVRQTWTGPEDSLPGGEPRHVVVIGYTDSLDRPTVLFDGEVPQAGASRQTVIELKGATVRAASVWCDEMYPMQACLEDFQPYYISRTFMSVSWFGQQLQGSLVEPPWQRPLQRKSIAPRALAGQKVSIDPYQVRFTSPYLSMGFSLKRPLLRFLAWDPFGGGRVTENFLYDRLDKRTYGGSQWGKLPGGNGPYWYDLLWDASPFMWTGTVEVEGNVVRYSGVHVAPGLTVDAEFEVGERDFCLRLRQKVDREISALDAAAWGFGFDGLAMYSITTNAMPQRGPRRGGGTVPNGGWSIFGNGMLDFSIEEASAPVAIQNDSTMHAGGSLITGIQLGTRHEANGTVHLSPGETSAVLRFEVGYETPIMRPGAGPLPEGLRRSWGSIFAFRSEETGFSNSGFGPPCHNCLYWPADIAAYTTSRPGRADMLELVRYAATLAVKGGNGYGCQWEMFMDTAPSLAISIGRLHQVRADSVWLKKEWAFLKRPLEFILDHINADGAYTSPRRTGNSGTRLWSSIAWDCIAYGHQDAYSTALAYRALRGGVALARDAGDATLSHRCAAAAERLQQTYIATFLNPETGLIAAWRSADGQLHDHAEPFINGIAICYGLVEGSLARRIMETLEALRLELEIDDFRYGIPTNLKPIPRRDYTAYGRGDPDREDGLDCFGNYINGALSITLGYFYLRALSITGFTETADRACRELLESFELGRLEARGRDNGMEFFSQEGVRTGGEGTIAHGYHILLAIAQHLQVVKTLEPEWWPA